MRSAIASHIADRLNFTKIFLAVAVVSILLKSLCIVHPFFGLEYEDSYIFTDVGRALTLQYDFSVNPYLTQTCLDGSLKDCQWAETFGGHFMVFPFVLSFIDTAFGYRPINVFWCNIFLSVVTLFISLKIADLILQKNNLFLLVTGLFVATTPFLSIFNSSGLSETFSSVFVVLTVYLYLLNRILNFKNKLYFIGAILLLSGIGFIKRDNVLLISLPVVDFILTALQNRTVRHLKNQLVLLCSSVLLTALLYVFVLHIPQMNDYESADIGTQPFSIRYAFTLFPLFIHSLFHFDLFGITGLLFLVSSLFIFIGKIAEIKIVIVVSWLYILLYSFHYRSYYFVKYQDVSFFETLRYYTNFYPLICISVVALLFTAMKYTQPQQTAVGVLIVVFIVANGIFEITSRKKLSDIEIAARINPVKQTISLLQPSDVILTDIPSIFHIYGSESLRVIDYTAIEKIPEAELRSLQEDHTIYILENSANQRDSIRYPRYYEFLKAHEWKTVTTISKNYTFKQLL